MFRGRTGVFLSALRCLPLTLAWAESSSKRPREYFQRNGKLPLPKQSHVVLENKGNDDGRKGILVVGDVHGCFDELVALHEKAIDRNDGIPFQYVILVGDLVNKGPYSAKVVRHVRMKDGWIAVRGNHDDGALKAALGDSRRMCQPKYQWIADEIDPLTDQDVEWMAELPYTIRVPARFFDGQDSDTLIVHAGFIPGKAIELQSPADMTNLRDIKLEKKTMEAPIYYSAADKTTNTSERHPWASIWTGDEFVLFGHDAKRGLQEYNWATGLDTGACYGKLLTGMILPQRTLVHVHSAAAYCSIKQSDTK